MCRSKNCVFPVFFGAILSLSAVSAQGDPISSSILLLKSKEGNACGSGFLLSDGYIITASHLARSVCPSSRCTGEVWRSNAIREGATTQVNEGTTELVENFPGLDIALLKLTPPPHLPVLPLAKKPLKVGDAISLAGFPNCKTLEVTAGKVTKLDDIWTLTNAPAAPGNSGSAVLNGEGAITGMVDEAGTVVGAALNSLLGSRFSTRNLRLDTILPLLTTRGTLPEESITREASLINRYHDAVLLPLESTARPMTSLRFFALVDGLRHRALNIAPSSHALMGRFAALNEYPSPPKEIAPTYLPIDETVLRFQLEQKGPYRAPLHPLEQQQLVQELSGTGLEETARRFFRSNYLGYDLMSFSLIVGLTVVALPLALLWAFSLGFVFARASGGTLKRVWITLVVALGLWPLSLLGFRTRERRLAKRRAKKNL